MFIIFFSYSCFAYTHDSDKRQHALLRVEPNDHYASQETDGAHKGPALLAKPHKGVQYSVDQAGKSVALMQSQAQHVAAATASPLLDVTSQAIGSPMQSSQPQVQVPQSVQFVQPYVQPLAQHSYEQPQVQQIYGQPQPQQVQLQPHAQQTYAQSQPQQVQPQARVQQINTQQQLQQVQVQPEKQQIYTQPQSQQVQLQPQIQQIFAQPQPQQVQPQPQIQQIFAQPQPQQVQPQPQIQQIFAQPQPHHVEFPAPQAGQPAVPVVIQSYPAAQQTQAEPPPPISVPAVAPSQDVALKLMPRWVFLVGAGIFALTLYIVVWFLLLPLTMRPKSIDDGFVRWIETQHTDGPPNCVLVEVYDVQEKHTVSVTLTYSSGKVLMFHEKSATMGLAPVPDGVTPPECSIKVVLHKGEDTLGTETVALRETSRDEWHEKAISSNAFKLKVKCLAINQAAWTAAGVDFKSFVGRLAVPEKPFSFAARALGLVLGVLYLFQGLPFTGLFFQGGCIVIALHAISSGFTYINMTLSFWLRVVGYPLPWYLSFFSSENMLAGCSSAISISLLGFFFLFFRQSCDTHVMATLHGLSALVAALFGVAKWRGEASWFRAS